MARSTYIYVLLTHEGHVSAAATVKYELRNIIAQLNLINLTGWRVQRLLDGQYTQSCSYSIEDFIKD